MALRRELGQAEIENLGLAALRDEDVGRLDVAMYDPAGVCRVERVGDLDGDIEQLVDFERAARRCGA